MNKIVRFVCVLTLDGWLVRDCFSRECLCGTKRIRMMDTLCCNLNRSKRMSIKWNGTKNTFDIHCEAIANERALISFLQWIKSLRAWWTRLWIFFVWVHRRCCCCCCVQCKRRTNGNECDFNFTNLWSGVVMDQLRKAQDSHKHSLNNLGFRFCFNFTCSRPDLPRIDGTACVPLCHKLP